MWNEISGRWFERVVALAIVAFITRNKSFTWKEWFLLCEMVDGWAQTGKVTEFNG